MMEQRSSTRPARPSLRAQPDGHSGAIMSMLPMSRAWAYGVESERARPRSLPQAATRAPRAPARRRLRTSLPPSAPAGWSWRWLLAAASWAPSRRLYLGCPAQNSSSRGEEGLQQLTACARSRSQGGCRLQHAAQPAHRLARSGRGRHAECSNTTLQARALVPSDPMDCRGIQAGQH